MKNANPPGANLHSAKLANAKVTAAILERANLTMAILNWYLANRFRDALYDDETKVPDYLHLSLGLHPENGYRPCEHC